MVDRRYRESMARRRRLSGRSSALVLVSICGLACGPRHDATHAKSSEPRGDTVNGFVCLPGRMACVRDESPPPGVRLRDCTLFTVENAMVVGTSIPSCGALEPDASRHPNGSAFHCISNAVTRAQPFRFTQEAFGIDSAVETGFVGLWKDGNYVVYSLHYDSDPCGGSCPQRGGTRVRECRPLHALDPGGGCEKGHVEECFECERQVSVGACIRGEHGSEGQLFP